MQNTLTPKKINVFLFFISVSLNIFAQWNDYKGLSSHPNFYTIPFKTESRKVSFADKLIYEKIEGTQIRKVLVRMNMGSYYADRADIDITLVPLMFLNNNWICFEGRLFKVENNIARGILNDDRDVLYQARDYKFSQQLVLDENGYIIDILKDKLCATKSCGELKILRNKFSLNNYKIPELPHMPELPKSVNSDLPYWASNPTYIDLLDMDHPVYNDSLIFFIVPIGGTPFQDLPINKPLGNEYTLKYISKLYDNFSQYYHHEEKYGYNYFFKKYNLSSEYTFEPKNITCPKNDACLILEFNHVKNKLNIIYDSGILPMFPKKITFDRTGRLLIVSNFDFVNDNARDANEKHESVIVFDIKNKCELFEIPGRFIDVTPDNKLVLNGNVDHSAFEKNNYGYSVPSAIFYDELDLKEILENVENFEVPSIKKSMNIDEFTTTEEFFNNLKELQKSNITNSQTKFQNNLNSAVPALIKSTSSYNSTDFLDSIAQEEAKLCNCFSYKLNALPDSIEVPFTYEAYDLNNQTLTFKFNDIQLNKFVELHGSISNMLFCDDWIEVCPKNSKNISWVVNSSNDGDTFTMKNITPEMGRSLKNNCKLIVKIDKNNALKTDQLQRYSQNPILKECLGELYQKNPDEINNLLGGHITSDHISLFNFYLKIGNDNILIKSR